MLAAWIFASLEGQTPESFARKLKSVPLGQEEAKGHGSEKH